MDPLSHLLDGPSARRAFALRVVMNPPWSIDVQDCAPLTVIVVMTGSAWVVADGERHRLKPGDVAVVRGPMPYRVADHPARERHVIVHPGQTCTTPAGEDVQLRMSRGVRTWGNTSDGETTMLIGTYETAAQIGRTVTAVLPRVASVDASAMNPALLQVLEEEIGTDAPGQGGAIDRLLDVLLVHAVRAWVREHPERASGWLAAEIDPLVAETLELFHDSPANPWTIASMGTTLNVSRATVASRFRAAVGEPPMTYLTKWRMLLASEMLADPRLTLTRIAERVGYGSPFAFSTAFTRHFGTSPAAYRKQGS
ncbi:AraC family transcriptional regulator [Arthrobacter sp. H35-D1]|uniref:AraC family transcriptional regulator n=1 Tax=Arthrobacter sp. H35-D1 TaxID=3046202 RepID=UPI0024B9966D|nr:AraC family transcriptional regulator [Arthrobacter sp. H35-D1]MDJ0314778.1 AraC family transcriptional regulator [Arthrobacter sp. H35-D1]